MQFIWLPLGFSKFMEAQGLPKNKTKNPVLGQGFLFSGCGGAICCLPANRERATFPVFLLKIHYGKSGTGYESVQRFFSCLLIFYNPFYC